MRYFTKPQSLSRLSLEARVVYTFFCVFMLIGGATSGWLWADDRLGAGAASAERYYLGEAEKAAPAPAGGPELEVPPESAPLVMPKSGRQVVETFHFHLFSASVCFLILAHLFMMCGLGTRAKLLVIGTGGLATLLHLLSPPLIRFVSPGFAQLMFPSALAMGVTWLWMSAHPLVEMWLRFPERE